MKNIVTSHNCRSIIDVCGVDDPDHYHISFDNKKISMKNNKSVADVFADKSFKWAQYSIGKLPIRLTLGNLGFVAIVLAVILPRSFTYAIIYPIFRLVFGTLYPAYASYKAVRTKNVKEYVSLIF